MQQWSDEALILGLRQHGEQSAIVHIMTRMNGRQAGYVRAAQSSRLKPLLQMGNCVAATWQSRLPDHLGYMTCEPVQALAMPLMQQADLALVLQIVTQMIMLAVPEKQPYPLVYEGTKALLQTLHTNPNWALAYVWWEVHLLAALGFGLRLQRCVQTDQVFDLTHVSPKSGHAVSRAVAKPYADRLLRLPECLGGAENLGVHEISAGLALTGYFMHQHIAEPQGKTLPEARQRLVAGVMRNSLTGPSLRGETAGVAVQA